MPFSLDQNYLSVIKSISDRIVKAQAPIRILDAAKWHPEVKEAFFASGFKKMPQINADYYRERCPLGFDPAAKKREFHEIDRDIMRQLGQLNPLTRIMRRTCREYITVVNMLESRGTADFGQYSQELYGSSLDVFHAGDPNVASLGTMLEATLEKVLEHDSMSAGEKIFSSDQAVDFLNGKMQQVFPNSGVRVILDDGIISDAAAGTDYIKVRRDATFNQQDLDVLEVHEGWVHLGTTLNGLAQPYCTFLSKGPPSSTITQEGLAVLTEIITLRSSPSRLSKLVRRVRAVTLAEDGADFVEVFRYLCDHGMSEEDSYVIASRVFRGSTPDGMPFTKDISYIKGFILTYNFLRLAVAKGRLDRLPLLFMGKILLEDIKILGDLQKEGILIPPPFIPPHFADMRGLVTWFSFSRFIGSLSFEKLEADYSHLID